MRKLLILILVAGTVSALAVRSLMKPRPAADAQTGAVSQEPATSPAPRELAAKRPASTTTQPFDATLAARAALGSHFVDTYLGGVVAAQQSTCTVLTPKRSETPHPPNPDLRVISGNGTNASARDWFDALGRLRLGGERSKLGTRTALQTHWDNLLSLAKGPASTPPLRVLIKHYPRPELPGRCHVVHATAYTAEDPYLDHPKDQDAVRGVIFDLRKTYQLAGDAPRLIEAQIEVHTELSYGEGKMPLGHILNRDDLGPVALDDGWSGHFEKFAGGTRFGMVWLDIACGIGDAAAWSRAYRITTGAHGDRHRVETEPLTATQVKALLEFVSRS